VEGLGEKPSSSASGFSFLLFLICDIKNSANFSQKTGKLVKLTQEKTKLSQIFGQKIYKTCWRILTVHCKNFI
jgi:hypothetical protein